MTPTGKKRLKTTPPPPTPKAPKSWDIPVKPTKGDQCRDDTFLSVGRAISQWEYFEGYLGLTYSLLVGSGNDDRSPAMRAYGAVAAFSTRLDMIQAAASAYPFRGKRQTLSEFENLLDRAKHFAARRNEIAHGIVQPYYIGGVASSGYALGPSRHATRKLKLTDDPITKAPRAVPTYAYTSVEIDTFTQKFDELANEAMQVYRNFLVDQRKTPP